ncbi:hypothetical protein IHN63_00165 [Deinococcus sp. 6YEL10]|uniref:hypothetical protein n=1 Tax=Deinococcus sp. 6YEL10 TaxID=2745870 RepID=UPI001E2F3ED0|nr:hypothetical protein [Deinococcus sp. 6YEL10]MCD0159712.1 hypothetical protein [Deinococcus sp. 6YEL10]
MTRWISLNESRPQPDKMILTWDGQRAIVALTTPDGLEELTTGNALPSVTHWSPHRGAEDPMNDTNHGLTEQQLARLPQWAQTAFRTLTAENTRLSSLLAETHPEAPMYDLFHSPPGFRYTPDFGRSWRELTATSVRAVQRLRRDGVQYAPMVELGFGGKRGAADVGEFSLSTQDTELSFVMHSANLVRVRAELPEALLRGMGETE